MLTSNIYTRQLGHAHPPDTDVLLRELMRTLPAPSAVASARQRYPGSIGRWLVAALLIGAIAVALGLVVGQLPHLSAVVWLGAAPAFVAFGFVVTRGPQWCLVGVIASVVFGLSQYSVSAGPIDVRVPDAFLVALAVWVVLLRARGGQRGYLGGRRLLGLWLAALGFSLYPVYVHGAADAASVVAWARLVATFSLVWFVPYAIRKVADLEFLLGAVAFIATAELGEAMIGAVLKGHLAQRLSGANGPNETGLLAALVLILAVHGPVPRHRWMRLTMLLIGALGLFMTRSNGGTAAAVLALGVYGLQRVRIRRGATRPEFLTPVRLLFMVLVGLAAVAFLRPTNLPWSEGFGESTTVHRLILADAGFLLFKEQPIVGVGWQRAPQELTSPRVRAELLERYGTGINDKFLPTADSAPEVHNAYIQILAESGLIGFGLFVALVITMARGIWRVLRSVRAQPALYICARASVVLLFGVLIWWNDNALYGAQPESVLAATFLGILAAVPAIAQASPDRLAVERAS